MVPPSCWPKRSTTSTSPGCSMSMAVWLYMRGNPAAFARASITPSRSGRSGMNCSVNARPTSFVPGWRIRKPSAYWLGKPSFGRIVHTSSADKPAGSLDERVRHLGAAVGEPLEGVLGRQLDHLFPGGGEQLGVRLFGRRQRAKTDGEREEGWLLHDRSPFAVDSNTRARRGANRPISLPRPGRPSERIHQRQVCRGHLGPLGGSGPRERRRQLAGWTGLEPATSDVTGRRSNQLNYHPAKVGSNFARRRWRGKDLVGGTGFEPVTPGV